MIILTRILVAAIGLLFAFMALGFWFNTLQAAQDVGLTALTVQGQSTVRADIGGFFAFCGGLALYGAARKKAAMLWPIALLVGIAFAARALSLIMDGPGDMAFVPMVAEAIIVAILLWASRLWAAKKAFGLSR